MYLHFDDLKVHVLLGKFCYSLEDLVSESMNGISQWYFVFSRFPCKTIEVVRSFHFYLITNFGDIRC